MLEQMGISVDYWTSTGNAMALAELNLKYFAPLRVHACLSIFVHLLPKLIHAKLYSSCNEKNVTEFYLQFNILYVLHRQSGDMFVVKVKPVLIKGVRIIVEHMIETLPDRKVHHDT